MLPPLLVFPFIKTRGVVLALAFLSLALSLLSSSSTLLLSRRGFPERERERGTGEGKVWILKEGLGLSPILSYPILSYPIFANLMVSYPILSYHLRSSAKMSELKNSCDVWMNVHGDNVETHRFNLFLYESLLFPLRIHSMHIYQKEFNSILWIYLLYISKHGNGNQIILLNTFFQNTFNSI